ncbi:MAG: hypothetical protein ACRENE_27150, partial [Polyangiaceae bacterium]
MADGLLLASLGLSMVGLGSCGGASGSRSGVATRAASSSVLAPHPDGPVSNVARSDYAGSGACKPCHADVYSAWERSPMHRMTRSLPGAEVRAPFD